MPARSAPMSPPTSRRNQGPMTAENRTVPLWLPNRHSTAAEMSARGGAFFKSQPIYIPNWQFRQFLLDARSTARYRLTLGLTAYEPDFGGLWWTLYQRHGIQKVRGSNPLGSTKFCIRNRVWSTRCHRVIRDLRPILQPIARSDPVDATAAVGCRSRLGGLLQEYSRRPALEAA